MHYVNEQQHFVTISPAMTEDERRHPEAKPKDLFFKEGISTFTKLLIFSSSYLLSRIGCS
jgi:hypothetical protein